MTVNLPDMPARIKRLWTDERGYPVPRFVEWLTNVGRERAAPGSKGASPDFRYADFEFRARAFRSGLCWLCGERLGTHRVFVIGPMCVINRTTMEPACHRDCAEFAAKACPFLVRPRMRRIGFDADEPHAVDGHMIKRNPGCVCLYETRAASAFDDGRGGWLIELGPPTRVDWWAEGRKATRAEIQASIDSGYPLLLEPAMEEGQEAVDTLARLAAAAMTLLPAA
jgi:hypothetical protein